MHEQCLGLRLGGKDTTMEQWITSKGTGLFGLVFIRLSVSPPFIFTLGIHHHREAPLSIYLITLNLIQNS